MFSIPTGLTIWLGRMLQHQRRRGRLLRKQGFPGIGNGLGKKKQVHADTLNELAMAMGIKLKCIINYYIII